MENFFIKKFKLPTLYPFPVPSTLLQYSQIFNLYHDYLIYNNHDLFTLNKKTMFRTNLAHIDQNIIHFSPSPCQKYFILILETVTVIINNDFDVINEELINTKDCYVCWSDDQVLISRESVRIYDLQLKVMYEGYGYTPIAFREEYYVYCIFDGGRFKFIEQNGLTLEVLEHVEIDGHINDMEFISQNVLAVVMVKDGLYYLLILACANNYWYLKNSVIIEKSRIYNTSENSVFLKSETGLWEYCVEGYCVEYDSTYAVNDGCNVKITDFNKGLVPQPFEHMKIECNAQINCVAMEMEYICIMHHSEIIVLKNNEIFTRISKRDMVEHLIKKKDKQDLDMTEMLFSIDENLICFDFIEMKDLKLYIQLYSHVIVYIICKKEIDKIFYHRDIQRLYVWNDKVWRRDNNFIVSKTSKIPVNANQTLSLLNHNSIKIILLGTQLNINDNSNTTILDKVTSCKIYENFLFYIKNDKLVTLNLTTKLYHLYSIHEKGAKILNVIGTKIILITKRGNLEAFESRFLLLEKILNLNNSKKYQEAIQLANANCIILSIFANKIFSFSELFESLLDKNLIINFIVHIYEEFSVNHHTQQTIEMSLKKALESINYNQDTFLLYENIKFIFSPKINTKDRFIDYVMSKINNNYDEIKIKIYTRLSLLEDAMFLIMQNTNLLNFAKRIKQDEKIIQAALATYNLQFARTIILLLNKDIYLDFIDEISNHNKIDQIIAINRTLNRKEKIVFYLSQKNQHEEEKYIVANKMYSVLDQMKLFYRVADFNCSKLPFLSRFDEVICRVSKETSFYDLIQADYLYKTDKIACIPYYMDAGLDQKAFEVALEIKDYIKACEINQRINSEQNYILIIQYLIKEQDYETIGKIYYEYLHDEENAYIYYNKAYLFKEARNINIHKFERDLNKIKTLCEEEIKQYIQSIESLIIRFDTIVERRCLFNDMTTTLTMTTSSKKNVLRGKVGSRYEKEYVLDQIRLTVNKVMHIRDNLKGVDVICECVFSVVWKDVLRIFEYARGVYDGNGPVIDIPRWKE